ncbi:phosphate uptake regulator, PhoU, partial [mine drainage metagenome]
MPLVARHEIELGSEVLNEHLFRELVAAYLSGASEISIQRRGGLPEAAPAVVQMFLARVGTGTVLEETAGRIVIRDLDAFDDREFSSMVRALGEAVLERLRVAGSDPSAPIPEGQWEADDDLIDHWAWAVHRKVVLHWQAGAIQGQTGEGQVDPIGWLEASRALERIGDHAAAMGVHAARWKATQPPESERALLASFHRQACDYVANSLVL